MHHAQRSLNTILIRIQLPALPAPVSCPALGQINPHTPLLVVSFRQFLQVSGLRLYYPRSPYTRFPLGHSSLQPRRHRLLQELRRSLIAFDPPAHALDRQTRSGRLLSPRSLLSRSSVFTPRCQITSPLPGLKTSIPAVVWLDTPLFLLVVSPTTHILTAAIHTDAPGAGITAAAGTRLALQSLSPTSLP